MTARVGGGRVGRGKPAARSHPYATDLVVAVMLCGAASIDNTADMWHDSETVSWPATLATLAAAYGAVPLRRRWPVAMSAVTVLAAAAYMMLSSLYWWIAPAPMMALYHLAVVGRDRRRLLVVGGLTALVLVGVPLSASWWDAVWVHGANAAVAAGCGLALAAGDATRSRRAYLAEVEERARRAEHDREQEARRRVAEERLRIARDLHDSMGHHIALINAQAGMAEHVFDDQPGAARQALGHIRQASRTALDELRETVGLLRRPSELAAPTEPSTGLSGIGGIDDLVASFRRSGMRVQHEADGTVRPLPPAADLTAYRVVQESLTNARKHAEGAAARVLLSFGLQTLHIVVENEGNDRQPHRVDDLLPPAPNDAGHGIGHGIVGMAERVSAIGGSLDAGPRPGGGFRVSAVLPLAGSDQS